MYQRSIKLKDIKEGMIVAGPVLSSLDPRANLVIANEGTQITRRIADLLTRHQVESVVVYSKEPTPVFDLHKTTKESIKHGVEPIITEDLRNEVIENIQGLFNVVNSDDEGEISNLTTAYQTVKEFEQILGQLVAAVTSHPHGLIHVYDLKKYDEYTYHHSLSVAVLAIATGQELGLDFRELMRLSQCAILHDIGKLSIPIKLLHKKSKLTTEEFDIIKSHAARGALSLKNKAFGSSELWNGVMFHHEKINGTGYPKQLLGNEIPLFSRIISVCDVYDALTSFRPYRNPMTPTEAYDIVTAGVGTAFEHDIVKAFAKKLTLYPLGTVVKLSNKQTATVLENGNELRPVVQIKDSDKIIDLSKSKYLNLMITEVHNPYDEIDPATEQE